MKVGIITKIGKNYGAVLQAYALKKACVKLEADAHVIKYTPDISRKSYKLCKFPWGLHGTIANLKSLMHFRNNLESTKRFMDFRNEFFDFEGEYLNISDLRKKPPECDVLISGSDQVWNPQISFDESFYLTFADSKTVKTAYAASIGLNSIPDTYKDEFKRRVEKFDYISVREKQAQEILSGMGIDADTAPDPTLLFTASEWNDIAKDTIEGPYILCYFVSFPDGIENIVKEISNKFQMKVVNLMTSEESSNIGDIKVRDAGPREFLGLFKNASFVITSSFHGTVFSIINKKPFATVLYKSTSSRVTELLNQVGLSKRIVNVNSYDINDIFDVDFYTENVLESIENYREHGYEILRHLLSITNPHDNSKAINSIERISNKQCTGCGACAYICPANAISMSSDQEGYRVPEVDTDKCIQCGKCLRACHIEHSPISGECSIAHQYAAKLKNNEARKKSRSGGVFVALSDAVLEKNGVVFGCVMDENYKIHHIMAKDKETRDRMCGSKYVQSNIETIYEQLKEALDSGNPVLFSGSPCQISAVSTLFPKNDYTNLYLCDYICHGVPSPGFWDEYVSWIRKKYKRYTLQSIDFRDKNKYSWESHVQRIDFKEKSVWSKRFTNIFTSNNCLRESCYQCKYATTDRISDFTIGDYWGIDAVDPGFNDGNGVSALIIRSEKGFELYKGIMDRVNCIDTSTAPLTHYNLSRPTSRPQTRDQFWVDFKDKGFEYVTSKYGRYDLLHRLKYRLFDHLE